jgi:hypothetical protein
MSARFPNLVQRVRLFLLAIAALQFLVVFSNIAYAAPSKDEYDLQERCGKLAAERFRRDWGTEGLHSEKGLQTTVRFRNHYNARLNRCFVLYTVNIYTTTTAKVALRTIQLTLFEANTNKDYGTYLSADDEPRPMDCWVGEQKCASRREFDALASQLLGD